MDARHFDRWARPLVEGASRRDAIVAALLGSVALARGGSGVMAKKQKHKRKRKKITRNSFGCVNVGGFCKNGGQCCSGICQGKKGKGKCQAHDASTCQPGQTSEECGGAADIACTTGAGDPNGTCVTTT